MRLRIAAIVIATMASMLVPTAALGAPPAQGAAFPDRQPPTQITRSYVGPAYIGARAFCGRMADGGPMMCTSVAMRSCRMWQRRLPGQAGTWNRGPAISNTGTDVFWAAPYSRGYHWVLSLQHGLGVMATKCLYELGPTWDAPSRGQIAPTALRR